MSINDTFDLQIQIMFNTGFFYRDKHFQFDFSKTYVTRKEKIDHQDKGTTNE